MTDSRNWLLIEVLLYSCAICWAPLLKMVFNVTISNTGFVNNSITNAVLVSDSVLMIFQWVVLSVVCQIIDVFGTVTNIINIICFVKQGFKDPINVSLLGLAFSDLGCLTTLIFTNICYTPAFITADLPFDCDELQWLAAGWPNISFTRITCWITAFITLERCLCIALPLQVKSIITSKRVAVLVVGMFIVLLATMAPVYMFNKPGMKFFPHRNKTLLGIIYPTNRENWEKIFYTVNNVFLPFIAFMIIIICTALLVFKLRENMKWRIKSTDNVSNRNQRVGKMVVIISSLFMVCFVPSAGLFIAMSLEPGLSRDGIYRNLLVISGGFIIVFQSINSASNIFIYYHMSSKYKLVFRQIFCIGRAALS